MPIRVYLMGGLLGFSWPFYYSNGLKDLAAKARALSPSIATVVVSYGESDIQNVVAQAAANSATSKLVFGGHSLGVRACVEAVRRLYARNIRASYVIGFDGTWNAPPAAIPGDIPALEFYNTNMASLLGHSKMYREDGSERGIRNIPLNVLHQNVDDDAGAHGLALKAIKGLL